MSGLDPRAKMECSVCHQPFYDPEQGTVKEYRYTSRYVSDSHRVMFHSGDDRDLNYDPDYYAASDRLEKRTRDNIARAWAEYDEHDARFKEAARGALGDITKPPNVSRETGATDADPGRSDRKDRGPTSQDHELHAGGDR